MKGKPLLRWSVSGVAALLVLLQFVPYGRAHSNPQVTQEPSWDSAETRALARRACYDCHSNETVWPWYSHIAPLSWLIQQHVDDGRAHLNFSEWGRGEQEAEEAAETLREGEMPLPSYLLTHPAARLSAAEREALIRGLTATLGGHAESEQEHEEKDDD
jgi:hypothetical protein